MFKKKNIQDVIRIVLMIALLVGVYFETGIFTTISCGLVFLGLAGQSLLIMNIFREVTSNDEEN